nr:MAG TPA: hypothetical protein [Caudoviricetes sp.]DAU56850.1 MAG TPA: hypothetical protein [Caudoviricetes sp.]
MSDGFTPSGQRDLSLSKKVSIAFTHLSKRLSKKVFLLLK